MREIGHDPVLQECQRSVGLLGRQIVVGGSPGVPGGLEPFGAGQEDITL